MLFETMLLVVALNANDSGSKTVAKRVPNLEAAVGDISGYYTCKGKEAGGKSYSGLTSISRQGDVYVVQWMVGNGSTFTGIGIRQGNTLAASWAIAGERGMIKGVNFYRIESGSSGPRLTGRWTSMPGPGVLQDETLTFLKHMDREE